jgi:alpha-D-xyloside xylohydrolase
MSVQEVAPGVYRMRLGEPDKVTPVGMRDTPILSEGFAALPPASGPPIAEAAVAYHPTRRGLVVELPLGEEEHVYGFGLQLKSHDQRGLKKTARVNSDPVGDTGDTHAPVPFYVSTAGYGVFVDTLRYASFYCGSHRRLRSEPEITPPAGVTIEVPNAAGADLYLFAGPTMRAAVQRYNLFSGGGCLPPYWGLGVWYRTWAFADGAVVKKQTDYFRAAHIPVDVYGFEPAWQSHCYSSSYVWEPSRFPDPSKTLADLVAAGYKPNIWEHAFVHPTAPFWRELLPLSGSHEVWGGLVPDFTLPETRRIFGEYHERELLSRGVAGFKLDECDNSDYTGSWSFPEHAEFPSGIDGEQMHSLFGVLYQRLFASLYRKADRRTLGQVRSSHALAAPLPFILYSDLYHHRDYIRALVNSGFSGILWSPELRQAESGEDLVRRVQTNIFSAHALVNAFQVRNPPWLQFDMDKNNAGELLADPAGLERLVRKFFELRMSFIPYLYAAFARYRFEGLPPVRALVMDWPDDPAVRKIDDQWMYGDSVLVAPLFAGEKARKVYLPGAAAGTAPTAEGWHDFWTGTRYEGGRTYEIAADIEHIPLFVREGTLLPLAKPVEFVRPDTVFELSVAAYGDRCGDAVLYEDDGDTYAYEHGAANRVVLSWDPRKGGSVKREGGWKGRRYEVTEWKRVAG